jgi:hypothetical protein
MIILPGQIFKKAEWFTTFAFFFMKPREITIFSFPVPVG